MKQDKIVGNYLQDGWREKQPVIRCLVKSGHPYKLYIFPKGGIVYAGNTREAIKAYINRYYYAGMQERKYVTA